MEATRFLERCTVAPWTVFPGYTKVDELDGSVEWDQYIRGFQVAMRDWLRLIGVQKREGRYDLVEEGFDQHGELRRSSDGWSSYTGRFSALGRRIGAAIGIFEKVVQCQGDERHGNLVDLLLMRVGRFEQLDNLPERGLSWNLFWGK
jgi:hypothetical protein